MYGLHTCPIIALSVRHNIIFRSHSRFNDNSDNRFSMTIDDFACACASLYFNDSVKKKKKISDLIESSLKSCNGQYYI